MKISTLEEATQYLHDRITFINISGIARAASVDESALRKALLFKTDARGFVVKIPKRALPAILKIIEDLRA